MTVRIPRSGQIQLSGHISASFNSNAGSQTHMNNKGVQAACHKTSTHNPTQRSMDIAHGVIAALPGDLYRSSYNSSNIHSGKADEQTMTNQKIYNKIDVRPDGSLWMNSTTGTPYHKLEGTGGQNTGVWMYAEPGALYVQAYKQTKTSTTNENVGTRAEWSSSGNDVGWGCSSYYYVYHYGSYYCSSARGSKYIMRTVSKTSSTWTDSGTETFDQAYSHMVVGYRMFAEYPGYNSRGALGAVKPHYLRLVATSGYA